MEPIWIVLSIILVLALVVGVIVFVKQKSKNKQETLVVSPSESETIPPVVSEQLKVDELETFQADSASLGRLGKLKSRLAASGSPLGERILKLLAKDNLSDQDWDEIEETLLLADVGPAATDELIENLKVKARVESIKDPVQIKELLRSALIELVDPSYDRSLNLESSAGKPAVILTVGVNGTGKTTTLGKLTAHFVSEGRDIILGAADTFRAAAADQLQTWGTRFGVETVRSDKDGADPASVAFEAVNQGIAQHKEIVLIDTAGRLQNKAGLMDELGKITRVIQKQTPITEVLLVIDATTGQNGLNQARVFSEVAQVTGIVLTKLDGTAKGGIVIAVQRELGVPVKFVGLGEGVGDLAPFEPAEFVDGIL